MRFSSNVHVVTNHACVNLCGTKKWTFADAEDAAALSILTLLHAGVYEDVLGRCDEGGRALRGGKGWRHESHA